jgi:DNA polymerase
VRLVLDLETTSTVDLRKTGVHAYAEHPDTRITVLCYAIDDAPVQAWLSGPPPLAVTHAITSGATFVAHNYLFEWNLYYQKLVPQGWPPVPLSQWSCTMARALVAGYPASLDLAGQALKLSIQKDRSAHDLMLRFARPRSFSPLTWWHETDPERFQKLCDYCARDVATERLLDRAVPELSPRERKLFELDHAINQRGLGIDLSLVDDLYALTVSAQNELRDRIARLTQGRVRSLNQVAQLRQWLFFDANVDMPDLRRATVKSTLADPAVTGPARIALQARLDASRSSTAKLTAIAAARSRDGRVRGTFQYYGANRTGRWAGRRVQPQNFFRGSIADVPSALRLVRGGICPADLDMLFEDSALGVVASCLRSTIVAGPLRRLCRPG